MSESVAQNHDELQILAASLLSTLDESVFFSQLCQFVHSTIAVDQSRIFVLLGDSSAQLIAENGRALCDGRILAKGEGPAGHVIRTRKPYFSNNASRDPLFSAEAAEGVRAELVVPVTHEGIVIATIHLQMIKGDLEFSRDHITEIQAILNQIKRPLTNMKMYLSAKHLNESLIKQIEEKEQELKAKESGLGKVDTYRIEEKEIVHKSESMKNMLGLADKVAVLDCNVLIRGEKGVGKEMAAKRMHCRSARKDRSFVSIDCSSLSERQLEIELFGEETGDFKGVQIKSGLLEAANGGSLYLNNIEKLSLHLQSKLSLFINEKMAFRVGGQMPYRSDVRVFASTCENLQEKVSEGLFREDLFFALNTVTLTAPSLRERREDIETLAHYFLNLGRSPEEHKSLSPCVVKALMEYGWPGNVRELQNVIERAFILSDGMIVEREHLAEHVLNVEEEVEVEEEEFYNYHEMTLDELEKRHICRTLDHLGGNKTKTARMLGITVKTLYNKLHSYGMIQARPDDRLGRKPKWSAFPSEN